MNRTTDRPGQRTSPREEAEPDEDGDEVAALRAQLAERTADLQRVQAEYANYRKRVQRDRQALRDTTVGDVLRELLPVLDAIQRARELVELTGGMQSITEELESHLAALGLESFGTYGEPFDPTRHEALTHSHSPDIDHPTCTTIVRRGYRLGPRLLRPAQVEVTAPPPTTGGAGTEQSSDTG